MLWLSLTHISAVATLDPEGNLIRPLAPLLEDWVGSHYRSVIAHFASLGQFIEAKIT